MTLIKPRAERELKSALKDFFEAASPNGRPYSIKIKTFTVEGAHAMICVSGKDLGVQKKNMAEIRAQLDKGGIVLESDEKHRETVKGLNIVWPGFGGPSARGVYSEVRTIDPRENGGNAALLGKIRDATTQLQIEAAKPTSFRDRLAAEPRAVGQSR